ncbi:MAG: transaldolase [Clostridiales bacterium]|jgi:transaldolase|nr:transaldolase [Clostridiales bacterium]
MTLSDVKIKIFADGADLAGMKAIAGEPWLAGLTTNPSLMKKGGVTDYKKFAKEALAEIKSVPVSFEVFSDDFDTMEKEAREIGSWADNVYIKIPIINSKGESSIPLIKKLSHEGLRLNVTAIFTLDQVRDVASAVKPGAGAYASVFAGRIADIGIDPLPIMREASEICSSVAGLECLWASTREVYNIIQAQECGCHIITVPNDILKKLPGFGRNINEMSLDTVTTFCKDIKELGFSVLG